MRTHVVDGVARNFVSAFKQLLGVLVVLAILMGRPDQLLSQETQIEISSYPQELERYKWDDLEYTSSYLATARDPKTGKREAAFRLYLWPWNRESLFKVYYPRASEGDVVPLFGTTCRVGYVEENSKHLDVGIDETGPNDGRVKVTEIVPPDASVRVPLNCLTIPNTGFAIRFEKGWHVSTYRIDVPSIFERDGTAMARFKVSTVNFRGIRRQAEPAGEFTAELKLLDSLEIPASHRIFMEGEEVFRARETFQVKHIVLPNPEKHIMGWVSLEPLHENWYKRSKTLEKP